MRQPDDDLDELLARQEGVLSWSQALSHVSADAVRRRVSRGRWRRAHRGVYVTHNGPLTDRQRLWVASLAAGNREPALLGGLSALIVLGLRRFASDAVHVLVPASHRVSHPPQGVRVHRTTHLPADDIHATGSPPCTRAARSVIDAAQWARTDDEARTAIAACFQQRLVGGDMVERALALMPTVRRRALIARTAGDARHGSHTISELDLVALCRRHQLPEPTRQVLRRDAAGRARYLDALFEPWGVRVEIDGTHHMSVDQWWLDMDRHNLLSICGETVLRFPAFVVREHPAEVAARLVAALTAAGWRPPRR